MPDDHPRATDDSSLVVDLVVCGAGPTGLYGAYYAGFRGFRVALIDSLEEPGGQIAALYPEKAIYDVAGFPAIKGQQLVDNLVEQAAQFEPRFLLGQRAETLERDDDRVIVSTHLGTRVTARALLIAGGIGTFTPRPLPDAARFEGRGLMYFVPRLEALRDRDVLIVGGGDSAFDWALALQGVARSVTLVHRRDRFRAHERTVEQVRRAPVDVLTHTEVAEIHGDEGIRAVDVVHNRTGSRRTLDVDAVVAALGFTADLGPISRWGLEQERRRIVVDRRMRTSVPRVYAAGDVTTYEGKVALIAVGFGEAATAVNNAAPVIDPALKEFPGHSSDR